ncbi:MAG: SDR family oxidoreductase [Xanthobacteraceae bacterium]|nr:SDR family oxidoreductase [Xanthobacteraceae bacterium]
MKGKVLVIGATGTVGRPLVKELLNKGHPVKAGSRTGRSVEGAEGVALEFGTPASFESAFDGVDRVYVLLPSGYANSKELLLPVIQTAASRKVKVVLQSVFGVDADDSIPYRQVEIALEKSATPYVILRPNWFANNFHTFWKAGIDHGQIALPAGEGKSSFIDARDIAEGAAAALTNDSFNGKAFNLTGPEALSYADAARILSEAIGKPVTYNAINDETFIGILTDAGLSADYAAFLASIFHPVRQNWTAAVTGDVQTLTGRPPRSLKTYAADNLALLTTKN